MGLRKQGDLFPGTRAVAEPAVYRSRLQTGPERGLSFAVRTAQPETAALTMVRTVLRQVVPALPEQHLRSLPQLVRQDLSLERGSVRLCSAFGGLALRLAMGAAPRVDPMTALRQEESRR